MDERSSNDYRKYYKILEIKGVGAFGIVYKGIEIKTNELRAIKVIQLNKLRERMILYKEEEEIEKKLKEYIDECMKEYKNMKMCSNINSVKFYEYFKNENNFVIIMELCDENLSELLLRKKKDLMKKKYMK